LESQKKHPRTYSFEFFPPNTPEGQEKLRATTKQLAQLNPKFFSVTYGAGGSTRERTLGTVLDIRAMGHAAAPHISCVASTRESIREWLQRYKDHGIKHLVALRGDLPSGLAAAGEFRYANELVEFIRDEFGKHFMVEVAAYPETHPQAQNAQEDLAAFKRKGRRRAPIRRSRSISTTRMPTIVSSTIAKRWVSTSRSCPASCRSGAIRSSRASPTRAAPRFRAGCAKSSKGMATTRRQSARSGSMW
jgi:hypothetical protein